MRTRSEPELECKEGGKWKKKEEGRWNTMARKINRKNILEYKFKAM